MNEPYRLYGHGYALLDHLRRTEELRAKEGAENPPVHRVLLEEGHRAPELAKAGLLSEDESDRFVLTEAGREQAKLGHPGYHGREVASGSSPSTEGEGQG